MAYFFYVKPKIYFTIYKKIISAPYIRQPEQQQQQLAYHQADWPNYYRSDNNNPYPVQSYRNPPPPVVQPTVNNNYNQRFHTYPLNGQQFLPYEQQQPTFYVPPPVQPATNYLPPPLPPIFAPNTAPGLQRPWTTFWTNYAVQPLVTPPLFPVYTPSCNDAVVFVCSTCCR